MRELILCSYNTQLKKDVWPFFFSCKGLLSGTFLGNMFFQQIPNDKTTNVSSFSPLFEVEWRRLSFLKMTTPNPRNRSARQKRLEPCQSRFVINSTLIFVVATLILSAEASKELKTIHFPSENRLSLEELVSERGK